MIRRFIGEFVVWEIFELAWGVPESEFSHFLVFQLFSSISHLCYFEMAEYGAVWGYFLCAREMAKLHGLVRELRMPLLARDDYIQLSFSQMFVTVLEVVAGDDVSIGYLSASSSFFQLVFLACNINALVLLVVGISWFTAMMFCFSGYPILLLRTEMSCGRSWKQSRLDTRRWVISARDKWSSAGRKPSNIGTFWISSLKLAALLRLMTSNFVYIVHS